MEELDIIQDVVDEGFLVNGNTVSIEDTVNSESARVMEQVRASGDFTYAFDAIRSLNSLMRMGGWASAKILFDARTEWLTLGLEPDHFLEQAVEQTGYKRVVLERYLRAWEGKLQLPPEYASKMLTQPIKNGIALGNAVAQGYEPGAEQIEKLVEAKSNSEFLAGVREITGREPRKNSLTIYLEPNGDIVAWQDNETVFVGYLNLREIPKDFVDGLERNGVVVNKKASILKRACERISKAVGMIER